MTLSYRTIKEEIEAGHYTVKRALEIIGLQHARQQITDDEYNELYSMATNLDANNSDDEAAICTRDSVIQLHYMPHELIGHYFAKVEDTGE